MTNSNKRKRTFTVTFDQRYLVVGIAIAAAFFGSYAYASSVNSSSSPDFASGGANTYANSGAAPGAAPAGGAGGAPGAGGAGGGCCSSGGGAAPGAGGPSAGAAPGAGGPSAGAAPGGAAPGGAASGGGCCGGGGSGKTVKGKAKIDGDVQKIDVNTSVGYSPNEITLKAGVPTEITFPPTSGCLGTVIFQNANVQADLSQGATVNLPAMQPGTYQFSCGMQMVFGKLIVK